MDLYAQDGLIPPTLRTARLTLRPFRADDAAAIIAALNDWEVTRWLTSVPFPYTHDDADWWLTDGATADGAVNWAIDDGTGLVGTVGVKPDLGYWLTPDRHGKGYMTEAATAAIAHHFTQETAPLVSGHMIGNGPSRAVLLKLGFHDTHVEDATRRADNRKIKLQRMALTHADWLARHG